MAPRPRLRAVNGDSTPGGAFRYRAFNKSLPMLLLAAREAVMQRFRGLTQAYDLTDQQWRVLRALAEAESLEIHALSALCRIHAASLSRILPKLDEAGWIARSAKAADQRCVMVSLTPRGHQLIRDTAPAASRIYEELARDVGPERLERIYALLEEFVALLGAPKADPPVREDHPAQDGLRESSHQ